MSFLYLPANKKLAQAEFSTGDTYRIALISDRGSYTPEKEDEFVSDVFDDVHEFDDASYSRKTLQNVTSTQDNDTDAGALLSDKVLWNNLTGDRIRSAIVYKQVGGDDSTPGDDPLVSYISDDSFPFEPKGSDVEIQTGDDVLVFLGLETVGSFGTVTASPA